MTAYTHCQYDLYHKDWSGFKGIKKLALNRILTRLTLSVLVVLVVSTIASQQEGSRFDPQLGPFCVEFVCSPRVCVGSLRVLRLPPTVQKHAC